MTALMLDTDCLEIYSAPSGKFKPHVDTPRSEHQMGSLVVCLPYSHQGGQLAVRHASREISFDWSSDNPSTIHWAAFFSDCEHEVLEVTSGHRITLAYNLFWTTHGPAFMGECLNVISPDSLHFFKALDALWKCPDFLPDGGTVGFACAHAYPHSSKASHKHLHKILKGIDMVVYQALRRLCDSGRVEVVDVLDEEEFREWKRNVGSAYDPYDPYRMDVDSEDSADELTTRTALTGYPSEPLLWGQAQGYEEHELLDPEEVRDYWSPTKVTWLNEGPQSGDHRELALAFTTYMGNGPEIETYYTSLAITARIKRPSK